MKKLNKLVAILVAMAMILSLGIISAFAADVNETGKAYFTKTWDAPEGVKTPAQTFSFTVVQDKEAGVNNTATIQGQNISYAAEETGTKSSTDLLAGQTWKDANDKVVPGVYVYTVKETIPDAAVDNKVVETVKTNNDKTTTTKTTTYSDKTYTMKVYVDKNGNVTGVVVTEEGQDQKKTSDEPTTGEDGKVQANGFNFRNTYSEKVENTPNGTIPDEPGDKDGASAYVEKKVTAENEALIDDNQEFGFSTTVTFPEIDPADSYTAKIVKADGTSAGKADVVFTKAEPTKTYNLKNGERLVFTNIDLGATYTATETTKAIDGYTYKSGEVTDPETITAAKNGAQIINNYDKATTPEGILISNLPYIALALVAIGGLVAYVVVRRRNADEA